MNTGDPCYSPGEDEWDIDGEPRVLGGRVDIGADEAKVTWYVDVDGSWSCAGSIPE